MAVSSSTKLVHRLRYIISTSWWWKILTEHDTEPTELIGGIMLLCWGTWLLLPMQTFKSAQAYTALATIPESLLGAMLLLAGINKVVALRNGNVNWRRLAAMISFGAWFGIASLFGYSDITNTGVV